MTQVHFEPGLTDPNTRTYYSRDPWTALAEEIIYKNDRAQTPLFNHILQIPGVAVIVGRAYSIIVQKSPLYAWDEVHPAIEGLLSSNLATLEIPTKDLQ